MTTTATSAAGDGLRGLMKNPPIGVPSIETIRNEWFHLKGLIAATEILDDIDGSFPKDARHAVVREMSLAADALMMLINAAAEKVPLSESISDLRGAGFLSGGQEA